MILTATELVELMKQDGLDIRTEDIHSIRRVLETEPEFYKNTTPVTDFVREGDRVRAELIYSPAIGPLYSAIFNTVTATWGPDPVKPVDWPIIKWIVENQVLNHATLSQALEIPVFVFAVTGAPRSSMDQHFRPRIGAAFAAQGVRDNDARHRPVILPRELTDYTDRHELAMGATAAALMAYAELVDKGASYQGARAVLPMGIENNWIAIYNWLSLSNMMSKRLHLCEQPETVEVAWKMWEKVWVWNPIWAKRLLPACVRAGRCVYSKSYTDGQLFSDLHDPEECKIFQELHPMAASTAEPSFSGHQPLANESFDPDRLLTELILSVIELRKGGSTWFDTFRECRPWTQ